MSMINVFKKELEQEGNTTRKMLERVPEDKYDWKPHPRSMSLKSLTAHLAELPGWIPMALNTSELDFAASPYQPMDLKGNTELMDYFEKTLQEGKDALETAREDQLGEPWTLRMGEQILSASTKGETIRLALNQIVHHRAQLGVFLRLLDIPIPGSYDPSADEHWA